MLENLIGHEWVAGTKIGEPTHSIGTAQDIDIGERVIEILPFSGGHTPGDLVVYAQKTRSLFTGDLVFHGRAASIPHADIPTWIQQLDALRDLGWDQLVPGHGPIVVDHVPFGELSSYLNFLKRTAIQSAKRGDTLAETLQTDIPVQFNKLATIKAEFQRSIISLFRKYEANDFETPASTN